MARTDIAPQVIGSTFATPSYAAVDNANGMAFPNSGRSIIHIKASGALVVTIRSPFTLDGVALVNNGRQLTFGGAGEKMFSIHNTAGYNQADGKVYLDFSTPAGTIAVFEGGGS